MNEWFAANHVYEQQCTVTDSFVIDNRSLWYQRWYIDTCISWDRWEGMMLRKLHNALRSTSQMAHQPSEVVKFIRRSFRRKKQPRFSGGRCPLASEVSPYQTRPPPQVRIGFIVNCWIFCMYVSLRFIILSLAELDISHCLTSRGK